MGDPLFYVWKGRAQPKQEAAGAAASQPWPSLRRADRMWRPFRWSRDAGS